MSGASRPPSEGLVVAAHGRHAMVEANDGRRTLCHPRGKKSECVVGDRVEWRVAGDEGVIERVRPRRNLLFRQDEWRSKAFAANLDQLLLLLAVQPPFPDTIAARALIAAAAAGIPAVLVLNKVDLPEADAARERLVPLHALGLPVVELSLKHDAETARARLAPLLAGRATLLLGPSGMGKSTLINRMAPGAEAVTGEISRALNAGRHTTTATRWYWLDDERRTALIDSPGFQAFGLHHVAPAELAGWMPDIAAHAGACRFYNCTHLHEPGCGVLAARDAGRLDASRHRVYREIFEELRTARY